MEPCTRSNVYNAAIQEKDRLSETAWTTYRRAFERDGLTPRVNPDGDVEPPKGTNHAIVVKRRYTNQASCSLEKIFIHE